MTGILPFTTYMYNMVNVNLFFLILDIISSHKKKKIKLKRKILLIIFGILIFQLLNFCNNDSFINVIANFNSSDSLIDTNDQIIFYDSSEGEPIKWKWEFEGGTPSTSNEKNPVIKYANEGVYNVSLKVSNRINSNIILKEKYIVVLPTK